MEKIPSLNWLRVFEAAARLESFARAAELLDISTSAVSQQIKSLETHFGAPLFERGLPSRGTGSDHPLCLARLHGHSRAGRESG